MKFALLLIIQVSLAATSSLDESDTFVADFMDLLERIRAFYDSSRPTELLRHSLLTHKESFKETGITFCTDDPLLDRPVERALRIIGRYVKVQLRLGVDACVVKVSTVDFGRMHLAGQYQYPSTIRISGKLPELTLGNVVLHEILHSLGLHHSRSIHSVMYPGASHTESELGIGDIHTLQNAWN